MILDLINIFKARRDPALAAKLGSRFATEQALDKLGWPLVIAKFWMSILGVICFILISLILFGAYKLGWPAALPAILPASIVFLIYKVWRGMNVGLERVKDMAQTYTDRGVDNVSTRLAAIRATKDEPT